MDFEEYSKAGRDEYAGLAETVSAILVAAIEADQPLRLQHVQHRAKDPERLRAKLEKRSGIGSDSIESVAKDLAGYRLVFYTNSDVSRFLSSGIVRDNFVIDWNRTKINNPRSETSDASELLISNNYVVKLTDTRALLPEYARFRDKWCEVQVQTALNHAWSEMAHDTIYKKPELKGFGGALMRGIEERMATIMRRFLLPAGYEFQKVQSDFERLSSGKELFDRGALEALANCDDNNARHDLLERFATYLLPNYDDIQAVYPEIRSALVAALQQARETPTQPIETPFGNLPGRSAEDIAEIVTSILERLRYVDVEATFNSLVELYPNAQSEDERRRWLLLAQRLAHHELELWEQAGPVVQSLLVERIRAVSDDTLEQLRPVILEILEQVLEPEISGATSTYNTITIHRGAVAPSKMLAGVRSKAIDVLETLFRNAQDDAEKRRVVHALSAATRTPHFKDPSPQLTTTVLDNALRIVRFYTEVATTLSYELLQSLEHDLLWQYRHNRVNSDEPEADDAVQLREALDQSILTFRDTVNADQGFVVHKTLVGFESVFPPAWEDDGFDLKGEKAYREQRINEFVEQVTEENAEEWFSVPRRCAQTESNDLATFPSFGQFLEKLAESKPQVVIRYLDRLEGRLANFLPSMLSGLEQSRSPGDARTRVRHWIEHKVYLPQIIHYLRFTTEFNAGLLEDALKVAIEIGDGQAVLSAVAAADAHHTDVEGGLLGAVFLPALDYLASKGDERWVNAVWPRPRKASIFSELSPTQADSVLATLVSHAEIYYHREEILSAIAANYPSKVVDFFGQRLASKAEAEINQRYDAVPFKFNLLHEPLATIPDYLIETARHWFEQDRSLFTYRGGRLLSNVFPNFSPQYERSLISIVSAGSRLDLEFTTALLRAYEGQ